MPDELEVSVTYNLLRSRHTYADTFHLTVATLGQETYSKPGDADMQKRMTQALESIARGVGSA